MIESLCYTKRIQGGQKWYTGIDPQRPEAGMASPRPEGFNTFLQYCTRLDPEGSPWDQLNGPHDCSTGPPVSLCQPVGWQGQANPESSPLGCL